MCYPTSPFTFAHVILTAQGHSYYFCLEMRVEAQRGWDCPVHKLWGMLQHPDVPDSTACALSINSPAGQGPIQTRFLNDRSSLMLF